MIYITLVFAIGPAIYLRILLGGWAGLLIGPHLLPDIRRYAQEYALRHAAARTTIEMGRLGPDAVTVGAATLPLADFLARGGSRPAPEPPPSNPVPGFRTAADAVRKRERPRTASDAPG